MVKDIVLLITCLISAIAICQWVFKLILYISDKRDEKREQQKLVLDLLKKRNERD